LHPLLGDSLSGEPGLLVEAPNPLLSGDVMATGHLDRSVRSAVIRHVGTSDVLLMVPLKTSDVPFRKRGRLHDDYSDRQRRGQSGEHYKDLNVICFSFKNVFVSFGM
jgi:hypothetical protein